MKRFAVLLSCLAPVAAACDDASKPAPRVVTNEGAGASKGDAAAGAKDGAPIPDGALKRIFEGDPCVVVEPARAPAVLGLDPDEVLFVRPVKHGPRSSCRYSWFDEVAGPSFSFGFDTLAQGEAKEFASQRDSMRRRQKRYEPVDVPGVGAFWDTAKTTLFWYPSPANQLTIHMGQSKLADPKAAAAGIVTTFLALP